MTGIDAIDERLAPLTSGYDASILEDRAIIGDWLGRRESHPFLDPDSSGPPTASTCGGPRGAATTAPWKWRLTPIDSLPPWRGGEPS